MIPFFLTVSIILILTSLAFSAKEIYSLVLSAKRKCITKLEKKSKRISIISSSVSVVLSLFLLGVAIFVIVALFTYELTPDMIPIYIYIIVGVFSVLWIFLVVLSYIFTFKKDNK